MKRPTRTVTCLTGSLLVCRDATRPSGGLLEPEAGKAGDPLVARLFTAAANLRKSLRRMRMRNSWDRYSARKRRTRRGAFI
jgi:hypothetical protein